MNSLNTGHNGTNFLLYVMTMMGTFMTENWYLVVMVVFGFAHVYVAWQRNNREKELHNLKVKALEEKSSL